MCGIVAYAGSDARAQEQILAGLRRLEHVGHDGSGLALVVDGQLRVVRATGRLAELEDALRDLDVHGRAGIGCARGSGAGRARRMCTDPERAGSVALIHSGSVENLRALRRELAERGTDLAPGSESALLAELVREQRAAGHELCEAVRRALERIEGVYALVAIDESEPERVVAARRGASALYLGISRNETFVVSDLTALPSRTRELVALEDGEVALVTREGAQLFDAEGKRLARAPRAIAWDPVWAAKGGQLHFMQHEIREQPRALAQTLQALALEGTGLDPERLRGLASVRILGCGSAALAGLLGSYWIEAIARIPARMELATELGSRDVLLGPQDLALAVSQSGESSDTLGALRHARERGALAVAVTNVRQSSLAAAADAVLYTQAGPELAIPSTKCVSAQLALLYWLALELARLRGTASDAELDAKLDELRRLPRLVGEALALWPRIERIARTFVHAEGWIFLGRGLGYPIALEGALKLKETCYIHADAYAAGELRHGPMALLGSDTPVVLIASTRAERARLWATAAEVRALGAPVIALAERGDPQASVAADHGLELPEAPEPLAAVLALVPLQILAYQLGVLRGCDVDQPRNLAKSVIVE